jgi:hypothetical protein
MSVSSQRGSSDRSASRGRSSSNGSASSSRGRNGSSNRSRNSSGKSSAAKAQGSSAGKAQSSGSSGTGKASPARKAGQAKPQASKPSGQSRQSQSSRRAGGAREAITNIAVPALTAGLGVAGGVLIGRTKLQRQRKVLGIPLPVKIDLHDVTQQIGDAGKQFGKLAREVQTVREKAEQIGRAFS